jgi:hypothetical protein
LDLKGKIIFKGGVRHFIDVAGSFDLFEDKEFCLEFNNHPYVTFTAETC